MIVELSRSITFEAAHFLPLVPEGHKCRNLHGHTYRLTVWIRGPVKADGFVLDSAILDDALKVIRGALDHKCLNDLEYLGKNPTAENLLGWIYKAFLLTTKVDALLDRVELQEGANGVFIYRGKQR